MQYLLDFDDFFESNNALDCLFQLRAAVPNFRVNLFTIPGRCTMGFLNEVRTLDWIDMIPHGYMHPHSRECEHWTYQQALDYLDYLEPLGLTRGFKAPQLVGVPLELDIADPYGLGLTAKMLMDTDAGRDTFHEVKFLHENGFESGMSIGGWVIKRNAKNKAEVVEYRLKEISVLTTEEPANQLSLVSAVKAVKELTEPTQEEFWSIIEKAYNVRFSDNILKSLEQFLTLKDNEPDQLDADTTQAVEPSASDIIKSIYSKYTKN